ncbi:hypothetical protein B0H63DRAFT_304660, partial [Podospora didyma]
PDFCFPRIGPFSSRRNFHLLQNYCRICCPSDASPLPTIMHHARFAVLFAASAACAFSPLRQYVSDQRSWSVAKETRGPGDDPNRVEWSPKPTDAPQGLPRFGGMDLLRRDGFTMGSNTCGFVDSYSSNPITCVKVSASCVNDGVGNMDCCTNPVSDCTSTMFSSCLDYSASQQGLCGTGLGPRTICCWASMPACYTWLFSTTATPNKVFSMFQCGPAPGGIGTMLATPPNFSPSTPTPTPSSADTSTTAPPKSIATIGGSNGGGGSGGTNNNNNGSSGNTNGGSSTPVGAIVGGAVGGAAILGISAFLIFYFRGRRAKTTVPPPNPPISEQTPMMQNGFSSPGNQQPPALAAAATATQNLPNQQFPHGQFQQYPQQQQQQDSYKPYDTPIQQQQQQQQYAPQQQQQQYPPQQQQPTYNNVQPYPQQQQQDPYTPYSANGTPGTTIVNPPSSTASPGSQMQPPLPQQYPQQYPPPPPHLQQQAPYPPPPPPQPVVQHELAVQHPVGTAEHRAELT